MVITSPRKKGRNISFKYNNRRFTTVTSHVNSSESNDPNTHNSDNVIGNSNLPPINVHTKGSLNELINFQKETDIESSTNTNEENTDENNASEEISSHKNSTGVIYHTCDDNGINLLNTQEEADVTSIQSINRTNDISINYDENMIHKYYAPFLPSKNHEDVSYGSEYNSAK